MSLPVLNLAGVHKSFGPKHVLRGIDLSVPEGTITGLIGKNGAGKSTMIKCLLGLLKTDAGTSTVFGCPSWNLNAGIKQRIGYVPQTLTGFRWMKVETMLEYTGAFYKAGPGIPAMNFYLPFAYYWITTVLAADFFSHRNRMPALYLQSNLPSRHCFARAAVLSYLLVVGRQMLNMTLAMTILNAIYPWAPWTHFFPLCLLGIALSFLHISLSLLASRRMVTPAHTIGWLIVNMFSIFPLMAFAGFYSHIWIMVTVAVPVGGLLFRLAVRRWEKTELDFL